MVHADEMFIYVKKICLDGFLKTHSVSVSKFGPAR